MSTCHETIRPNPEADRSRTHEEAICGGLMILGGDLLTVCREEGLSVADFYYPHTTAIYSAAAQLVEAGRVVDAVTVAEELQRIGVLDDCGGLPALMELQENSRTATGVGDSAQQVVGKAKRRRLTSEIHRLYLLSQDPEVSPNDIAAECWELSRGGIHQKRERFPSLTPSQLDAGEFDLSYLVEGILVEGQPAILAGGKKCLKTNTSIDLGLSLASGIPFLGKFRVIKTATVGILSGESGAATIQETARRIALSKGQPLRNFTGIHFCFSLPRLGSPDDLRSLRAWIEEHGIEVLMVDPVYLALDGIGDGASNLFTVGQQLKPLGEMMQELGVTLVLIHHLRKTQVNAFAAPELEDIAWAGFQEFARQWLLVGRRESYDPENGGSHKLWLNVGGSAGHSSLWALDIEEGTRQDHGGRRWEVDVLRAREARAQAQEAQENQKSEKVDRQRQEDTKRILAALAKFPNGETTNVIKTASGISGTKANAIIAELLQSKTIQPCRIKRANGHEYDGVQLTRIDSDSPGPSESVRLDIDDSDEPPFRGSPSRSVVSRNGSDVHSVDEEESESESLVGLPALPRGIV